MTATQTRIRRGTEAQCNAMTPASSEVVHDTTNNRLRAGDGSRQGGWDIPNFDDIQKNVFRRCAASGTNDIALTSVDIPIVGYAAGQGHKFKATATNTGAVRFNVDSKGWIDARKKKNGVLSALEAGDIILDGYYEIDHDGTYYQIAGLDEASGSPSSMDLLIVATGGGASYDFTHDIGSNHLAYMFVLDGVLPSSSDVFLQMRTRRTGQGSFDAGSGNYSSVYNEIIGPSTNIVSGGSGTSAAINLTGLVHNGGAGGNGVSGQIIAPGLPLNKLHIFRHKLAHRRSGVINLQDGAGAYLNTLALNGVQFFYSSGNIASGSIYMYGLKTSL